MEVFDLAFKKFLTPKYATRLYFGVMLYLGIQALTLLGFGAWEFMEFSRTQTVGVTDYYLVLTGMGMWVAAPIVFFGGLVIARITIELVIVIFRIEEHLRAATAPDQT